MLSSRRRAATLSLAVLVAACTDRPDRPQTDAPPLPPSASRLTVIFDYSPTVSDAGALLYLAAHPDVDLLAVTLPGTGEADCDTGVTTTRALLDVAGRVDVPVGCGRDAPLDGDRDWPEPWRNRHEQWSALLPDVRVGGPMRDAEELLATTLAAAPNPVTVVTVGPLTNVGAVLGDRAELRSKVNAVVVMGGAVRVAGNVENAPHAEWNLYIDPEAVRRTLAAGVPVLLVPLDATNALPWNDRLAAQLALVDTPAARTMSGIIGLESSTEGLYLWDELAVMAAVTDGLVTVEEVAVTVDGDGATVPAPDGVVVHVATATDAAAARLEWLRVLAGGTYEAPSLTAEELTYAVAMGGIATEANAQMADVWSAVPPTNPTVDDMVELATTFTEVVETLRRDAAALRPPSRLAGRHDAYLASLAGVLVSLDDLVAEIRRIGATDDASIDAATAAVGLDETFANVDAACRALATPLLAAGGPRPCGL